ncbi:SHOCT domain-containing protein [Nitrosopumilus sp. S6]
MAAKKKVGYIERFLKKADKAIDDGVKRADEVLEDAVEFGTMTAKQAAKASKEMQSKAKKESEKLHKKGAKKIEEGITAAKNVSSNTEEDLATLEKLGKLRKAGVLTEKEFQSKKKKILDKI